MGGWRLCEPSSRPQTEEGGPAPDLCKALHPCFLNLMLCFTSLCSLLLGTQAKMAAMTSYLASQTTDLDLDKSLFPGQDKVDSFLLKKLLQGNQKEEGERIL